MAATYEARAVSEDGKPLNKSRFEKLDLPARFEVRAKYPTAGSPLEGYSFIVEVDQSEESMEISELAIIRLEGAPAITSTTLREVPVTDFVNVCRMALGHAGNKRTFGEPWGDWGTYSLLDEFDILRKMSLEQMRSGGLRHFPPLFQRGDKYVIEDDNFLADLRKQGPSSEQVQGTVRWLYIFAEMNDLAPVGFIAEVLRLPSSTASHWVKLARQAGALPPTTRRSRTARG